MIEPLTFSETGSSGETNKWHFEVFAFKLLKLNHSKTFSVVASRLLMTSLNE